MKTVFNPFTGQPDYTGEGGGLTNGDKGDITVGMDGESLEINPESVTYEKIQDVSATNKLLGRSTAGAGNVEEIDCTSFARTILDDASASDARTTLGLGTIATQNANNVSISGGSISGITDLAVADGGTGASDASGARTNLGLGTMATQAANNVSISGGSITGITDLAVADGGTGASTAAAARTNLGLDVFNRDVIFDGGGSVLTVGKKAVIRFAFPCTISKVTLIGANGETGSIVFDIWKDTYANHPPTVADSITASAKPTISSATKSEDSTLTGWTKSIAAGDELIINIDSVTTFTNMTVSIDFIR